MIRRATILIALAAMGTMAMSNQAARLNRAGDAGPLRMALAASDPPRAGHIPAVEQGRSTGLTAYVEQPRAAAYFVGDLLTQRVLLRNSGNDLAPVSLPTPGRVSAWFERRQVMLETDSESRRWLAVQYQVLNAPQKLTAVVLPGWTLAVKGPAVAANAVLTIPPTRVNVAPLSPPGSPSQVGVADLRPDRVAPLIAEAPIRRAITFFSAALASTLVGWLAWVLWRNRRANQTQPFARALRELRGISDREPRAWQILHRAFDRTAGRVIHTATLPELFERAPQLLAVREQVEQFFAQSSWIFFAAPAPPGSPTSPSSSPLHGRSSPTAHPVGVASLQAAPHSGPATATPVSPHALCEKLRRIERRCER